MESSLGRKLIQGTIDTMINKHDLVTDHIIMTYEGDGIILLRITRIRQELLMSSQPYISNIYASQQIRKKYNHPEQ